MSDLYSELLVKKERTMKDKLMKGGMIALVVIFGLGIVAYFVVIPGTDLEFEYLFVNGELDIDKIMAKSKRKRVKNLNISECDLMAPLNSHRMDYYNSNQKLKIQDFSSGNPEHKRFAIIARDGADTCKVIIEPDETLAKTMRNTAPSKVFLD